MDGAGTEREREPEHNHGNSETTLSEICSLFHFTPLVDRHLRTLSAGEVYKCIINQALLRNPDLLVLDESFDGLDQASRERMMGELDELYRRPDSIRAPRVDSALGGVIGR